ncbi:oligosaccharide repeat unit polymerase [Antricoccus suffuscus]|uniref:Oligosaccharide repeat unit polymerase n=1 Tax=Antricoccus suffuscus TaxID=1629062 RepID=A0A2T1A5X5_9ACTN|nr:oligosaccharide repeat unit polymerase [Antricoccus suffuscus]
MPQLSVAKRIDLRTFDRRTERRRQSHQASLIFQGVVVLVLWLYVSSSVDGQRPWDQLYRLAWAGNLLLIAELVLLRRITGRLFSPVVLYFLFLWLFTWGQLALFAFGVSPDGADVLNREQATSVVTAGKYFLYAYWACCLGAVVANWVFPQRRGLRRSSPSAVDWESAIRTVGYLSIAIGIVPFAIINFNNFRVIFAGGYSAYYVEGARLDSPLLSVAYLLIVGLVLIGIAGSLTSRRAAIIGILAIAAVRFAAGDRGEGMIYLVTALLIWTEHGRGVRRRSSVAIVGIGALALLLIPAIGLLRQSYGTGAQDFDVFRDNPVSVTLSTVGGTLFPLVKVVELVPGAHEYALGSSYVGGLLAAVPEPVRSAATSALGVDTDMRSPGVWLQTTLNMSYGPGFTPFAESYLNFGSVGGCIAMALYGGIFLLLLRMPTSTDSSRTIRVVLVLATFALVGFSVRGSINSVFPYYGKYVVVPAFVILLVAQRSRLRRARAAAGESEDE